MKKRIRFFFFSLFIQKKSYLLPIKIFCSLLFQAIVWVKHFFYKQNVFSAKKAPIPVVSIGNIIVGGSGKTPFTLLLCQSLLQKKIRVGIATRGYLSKLEKKNCLGCKGNGPLYSSEVMGDEPYLLAKRCPSIHIAIGKNRLKSAQQLHDLHQQIVLLDDGMQHRRLYRDIEIVMLHGKKLLGNHRFIPWGFLRDLKERLQTADFIFLNHCNKKDFTRVKKLIRLYSLAPISLVSPKLEGVYSLDEGRCFSLENARIGVFCALADPEPFVSLLKEQKAYIIKKHYFPDHTGFQVDWLQKFAKSCKTAGASYLVCTEKDGVKLSTNLDLCLPVVYVKMQLHVIQGKENWNHLMDRITSLIEK